MEGNAKAIALIRLTRSQRRKLEDLPLPWFEHILLALLIVQCKVIVHILAGLKPRRLDDHILLSISIVVEHILPGLKPRRLDDHILLSHKW